MEEAKFSFNVKFNLEGFDCQITVRADTTGTECIDLGTKAIHVLSAKGAIPDRRWEAIKNNYNSPKAAVMPKPKPEAEPEPADKEEAELVCPECGLDDMLELIQWREKGTGNQREAYKCQRCNKWLPRDR